MKLLSQILPLVVIHTGYWERQSKYLMLLIPVIFLLAAWYYKLKYIKLKNSGKIPEIASASRNVNVYFALSILSLGTVLVALHQM